jgi:hypothetical protein
VPGCRRLAGERASPTEDKLAQIDATLQRQDQAVHLGMPAFPDIAGRSVPGPEGQQ